MLLPSNRGSKRRKSLPQWIVKVVASLPERFVASDFPAIQSTKPLTINAEPDTSDQKFAHDAASKFSLWSKFFASTFSIFGSYIGFSSAERKETIFGSYVWTVVKKNLSGVSVRRLQELILWASKPNVLSSTSDIRLLGMCYKVAPDESTNPDNRLVAFFNDFSLRLWMTYRKSFDAISDSKFMSDVNWGCMIRSSQMLVAQALVFHHLGRSWRRPLQKEGLMA